MNAEQAILYAILGAVILLWALRAIRRRGIPRYSPIQVHDLISQKNGTLLLDVRTDAERTRSRITGSHHIPLHRMRAKIDELEKYRGREIVCYCQTGNRSLSAAAQLRRLGFSAASMDGGIVEWNAARLR